MERYQCFCRVCCNSLDRKYSLLTVSGHLTTIGQAIVQVSELDIENLKGCNAYVCRHCYRSVLALKKLDEDVRSKIRTLDNKISAATTFFTSSKRVIGLSSPVPPSPSSCSRSPLEKRSSGSIATRNPSISRALFTSSMHPISSSSLTSDLPSNQSTLAHAFHVLHPQDVTSAGEVSKRPSDSRIPLTSPITTQPCNTPSLVSQQNPSSQGYSMSKPSRIPRYLHHAAPLPKKKPTVTVADLQYVIDEECSKLCSIDRKVFRNSSVKDLTNFQWEMFEEEMEQFAPTLWAALKAAATSMSTKYKRKIYLPLLFLLV